MSTYPPTQDGITVELAGALGSCDEYMESLKDNSNISTICYYSFSARGYSSPRKHKRTIHALANLLKANVNIKNLKYILDFQFGEDYKEDYRDTFFASFARQGTTSSISK